MYNQVVRVGVGVFIVKGDCVLVGKRLSKHGNGTFALPGIQKCLFQKKINLIYF